MTVGARYLLISQTHDNDSPFSQDSRESNVQGGRRSITWWVPSSPSATAGF
jgi:hypothetical protein